MTTVATSPVDVETTRVVAVVSKNLDPGRAMNTVAHLTMGLANLIGDGGRKDLKFLDFVDADGQAHPSVSARSLIVLRGSPNEIRSLRNTARTMSIQFVDFITCMTGDTYVEQLRRTAAAHDQELEYCGIALFGLKESMQPLTKKFSLWK